MMDIPPSDAAGKLPDDRFIANVAEFSLELFKKSAAEQKNALVSPLSVMLALAMAANGADRETLSQMEGLLGGGIALPELNEYLCTYAKNLPSGDKSKLKIANSIWFRDDENRLYVEENFLQKNADYYSAAAYKAAFGSQTLKDINNWVKTNTDGMIENILDKITDEAMLYLINAVVFDAEWQRTYCKENIIKDDFTDINGNVKSVDFMQSSEYGYLDDGMATGFVKRYAGDSYSFAALLPNKKIAIGDYIASLTGEKFINTLKNAAQETVYASMPKFKYEYEIQLNDALKALGMPDAFDVEKADFKKMAKSSEGSIFIGKVLHKTYISVDELGTKAGAATMVEMETGGMPAEPKIVRLDRPFVYAIIDNATNLPVFIGTVLTIG
jgi:serpin B